MASVISARKKLFNKLKRRTHFTVLHELEYLSKKYHEVCDGGPLNRMKFREFLFKTFAITDDNLLDRVFRVFDLDSNNVLSLEEWICGLSIYLRGTVEERTNFCFKVYDVNTDGNISREEMYQFLRQCIAAKTSHDDDPEEDGVRDLIEIIFKYMGGEQHITPEVFQEAVEKEPLWTEFLGDCLPSFMAAREFEKAMQNDCQQN